jgi:hypothetical protein
MFGHGIMVKNGYFLEILKLRRESIAEIAQKIEHHVDKDPL